MKHLSVSTDAMKQLVAPVVSALEKRRTLSENKRDALKKMEKFKTRLTQMSTQHGRLEKHLKNYCQDN